MPTAEFSPDRVYRYTWERATGGVHADRLVVFVMLNPSTADEHKADPTVTRCLSFARAHGYGHLLVVNLYALRSTEPVALWHTEDPIGPENNRAIADACGQADLVVVAWGEHGRRNGRGTEVETIIRTNLRDGVDCVCLGRTRSGQPRHPLYLPRDSPQTEYTLRGEA